MRFRFLLAGVLLALPFLSPAQPPAARQLLDSQDFTLQVLDEQGQAMPIVNRTGWAKIAPEKDKHYTVQLTNKTNERIGIVASIDGVDPFTGKKAYLGQSPRVLDPGQSLVIRKMHHRKKGTQPLQLDPERTVGSIDVISYRENMTYPHFLPWSAQLQKTVGGEVRPGARRGEMLWLPPSGAPFRKLSQQPSSTVHLEYGSSEMMRRR